MYKKLIKFLLIVFVLFSLGCLAYYGLSHYIYRLEYTEVVSRYSKEFGVDDALIYAVIKVESNFDPVAVSDAGAIGLMQIIEDSFEWVKKKLNRDDLSFYDMYTPEHSIRFGCYMMDYLYDKYGSIELAAAAYHSGMTTVDNWIEEGIIDPENVDVSKIQGDRTRHYVVKILRAYKAYNDILS